MVKVEGVGRTISNTPMKPATMAAVRRNPTFSLRKITDTRTTASGTLCKMAVRLASGMCGERDEEQESSGHIKQRARQNLGREQR